MHIQLVGLPASGKSTLAKALVDNYPEKYILGQKRYDSLKKLVVKKPILVLKVLIKCIPISYICFLSLMRSDVRLLNRLEAFLGLVVNLVNYEEMIRGFEEGDRIVVWDEMAFQRVFSIFAYSKYVPAREDIVKYTKWVTERFLCKPIFVTSGENYLDRVLDRGVPNRMLNFNDDALNKVMKTHTIVFEMITENYTLGNMVTTNNEIEKSILFIHEMLVKNER